MSPCQECPLIAAAGQKLDPLAERRAYVSKMRALAVEQAAHDVMAVFSWASVKAGAWSPPWARTREARSAEVERIAAALGADYGQAAVELLRGEVRRRKAINREQP